MRILVLAPHTDDMEFGCGATVAKLLLKGANVRCITFSIAEDSVPAGFRKDILKDEAKDAAKELGLSKENLQLLSFPVRKFDQHRQEILEILIKLKKDFNPFLVFTPSTFDKHQDHQVISNESIRAFKDRNILGYELPWNNLSFPSNFFSKIDKKNLETKIKAIQKFQSQSSRPYSQSNAIESLARVRGLQSQSNFAECFEVIKLTDLLF